MREQADWRVASYSAGEGNCVEVGKAGDTVLVRDTKDREAGALRVSPAAWRRFADTVRGTDATTR